MPRAQAASDVYTAIAEPRRRAILELVCQAGELPVGGIVRRSGFDQPSVSKHLRVLREADLVRVRRDGRRRLYSAEPAGLEDVRTWVERCERMWERHLNTIGERAERAATTRTQARRHGSKQERDR